MRASCGHSSAYPVVRDAAAGLGAMRRAAAAGVALADGCVESIDVLAELRAFAKAGTCDDAALCDLLRCCRPRACAACDRGVDSCGVSSCSLLTVDAHALLGMEKRAVIEQGSVADMMLLRRPRRCARRAGAVLSLRSVLAGVSTDAVVAIFKVAPAAPSNPRVHYAAVASLCHPRSALQFRMVLSCHRPHLRRDRPASAPLPRRPHVRSSAVVAAGAHARRCSREIDPDAAVRACRRARRRCASACPPACPRLAWRSAGDARSGVNADGLVRRGRSSVRA